MHDSHVMYEGKGGGQLGKVEADDIFVQGAEAFEVNWEGDERGGWKGGEGVTYSANHPPTSNRGRKSSFRRPGKRSAG
jgi:hypothetical protein